MDLSCSLLSSDLQKFVSQSNLIEAGTTILQDYLELQSVRIYPASMTFKNAIEGKRFNEKLVIKNCGTKKAFVRICSPTAHAFTIKSLMRGRYLSPGLAIVRHVSYTYMRATAVPFAYLRIHINDVPFHYQLKVHLSEVKLSISSHVIDFGTIDAGHPGVPQTLTLHNFGSKGCRFGIDLGRNKNELVIEPIKGIIKAAGTVIFHVECLGLSEGSFSGEFWIKCETPIRVEFSGKRVLPLFHSIHPNSLEEFTLVDFPKTYFGTHSIRTLVVNNYSSMPAMFCAVAKIGLKIMSFEDAQKEDPQYGNFSVSPAEGAFLSNEAKIFNYTFHPIKNKVDKEFKSFCATEILRIPFTEVTPMERMPSVCDLYQKRLSCAGGDSLKMRSVPDDTSSATMSSTENFSFSSQGQSSPMQPPALMIASVSKSICVLLYGETEKADILIRPDALDFLTMKNKVPFKRELLLKNKSHSLPIIFKYKKVCYVEVIPKEGFLLPGQSMEVECTVKPTEIGLVVTKIGFDLFYFNNPKESRNYIPVGYSCIPLKFEVPSETIPSDIHKKFNMGITPRYIKEVGFRTDDVRFNTKDVVPRATLLYATKKVLKKCDDLIAFPNDRPNSIRPWSESITCRTIFTGIPRLSAVEQNSYRLTRSKLDLKLKTCNYYNNYMRKEHARVKQLTNSFIEHEILNNLKFPKITYHLPVPTHPVDQTHVALSPLALNGIKVYPKDINLGKVAVYTKSPLTINIENQNKFGVRIFARTHKRNIQFPNGDHFVVKPSEKFQLNSVYIAGSSHGRYFVTIDIILNDNHIFAINVTVDILPSIVTCDQEEIIIEKGATSKYVTLTNELNIPISFQWIFRDSCFMFRPRTATIPAKCKIICLISYIPLYSTPVTAEVTLLSEDKAKTTITVTKELEDLDIVLKEPRLVLENIPLNLLVEERAVLCNLGNEPVAFLILNPEPMEGVKMESAEGVVEGKRELSLRVLLKVATCAQFTCDVKIDVQGRISLMLELVIKVIYPGILISPTKLSLREIVPNSFDFHNFEIANNSAAPVTIEFRLQDYHEYTISEQDQYNPFVKPLKCVELLAYQSKLLFLHFNPMGAGFNNLYLPIVINDILGPTRIGVPSSHNPLAFTGNRNELFTCARDVRFQKMPKELPTLQIQNIVKGDLLRFSKLSFNFKYCLATSIYDVQSDLTIWNGSKDACEFCIRTDGLLPNFSLSYVRGNEISFLPKAIVCLLGPNEDLVLSVEYRPSQPGLFHSKLPIYVNHYLEGELFNYLYLRGKFRKAEIALLEQPLWLPPTPLKFEATSTFLLKTFLHNENCVIMADTDVEGLHIEIKNTTQPTEHVEMVFGFYSEVCINFKTVVRLYCTCGSEANILVKGICENCTLTTYGILRSNRMVRSPTTSLVQNVIDLPFNSSSTKPVTVFDIFGIDNNITNSCFPLFPLERDRSAYAKYLRDTVLIVEEWFYHQVFYKQHNCKIPDGFSTLPKNSKLSDDGVQSTQFPKRIPMKNLKIVEILLVLAGAHVNEFIPIGKPPIENMALVNYAYEIYSCTLKFIINQGGTLPHIKPAYLLEYKDYLTFVFNANSQVNFNETNIEPVIEESKFKRLHKQCWLDICLQMFKVFVLARVRCPHESKPHTINNNSKLLKGNYLNKQGINQSESIDVHFFRSYKQEMVKNVHIFNKSETILLHWLKYHFENNACVLWKHFGKSFSKCKDINEFGFSLKDSIVLMVITLTFCPYLLPYLKDFYLEQLSEELEFHNAAELIRLWKLLNFSFVITPTQIVYGHRVQLLMLVTYLYQVLPTFFPKETILFKTGLSTFHCETLHIQNTNHFPISYKAIFVGNEADFFTVTDNDIYIEPMKEFLLKVSYFAKRASKQNVTLILNGEASSTRYAKSMVFKFLGEPVVLFATTRITIPLQLYNVDHRNLKIKSPYQTCGLYSIYLMVTKDDETTEFQAAPGIPVPQRIHRIFCDNNVFASDEEGVGSISVTLTTILPVTLFTWIVFSNHEIGDFTIELISTVNPKSIPSVDIPLSLPDNLSSLPCTCKFIGNFAVDQKCPRRLFLQVPSQNIYLWNTVMTIFQLLGPSNETDFWARYRGSRSYTEILKWYLETRDLIMEKFHAVLFKKAVKYAISNDRILPLSIPSSTIIENVHSLKYTNLPIHIDTVEGIPDTFSIQMMSETCLEYRKYNVQIKRRNVC